MNESINAIVKALNTVTSEMANVGAESIPAMTKAVRSMASALDAVAKVSKSVKVVEVTPAPADENETVNVGVEVAHENEGHEPETVEEPSESASSSEETVEVSSEMAEALDELVMGATDKEHYVIMGEERAGWCEYGISTLLDQNLLHRDGSHNYTKFHLSEFQMLNGDANCRYGKRNSIVLWDNGRITCNGSEANVCIIKCLGKPSCLAIYGNNELSLGKVKGKVVCSKDIALLKKAIFG